MKARVPEKGPFFFNNILKMKIAIQGEQDVFMKLLQDSI